MNKIKNYYVYIITNLILNKQYVGSRSCYVNPNEDNYMGSSKYLNIDFKIYGKENFKKEILNSNIDNVKELLDEESNCILKYNTLAPNGYNRFIPNQRKSFHMHGTHFKLSEEHKQKLRKPKSEETKKKISAANKGKRHKAWSKGLTKITNESLMKMSIKSSIRVSGEKNPNYNGKITNRRVVKQKISKAIKFRMANNPEYKSKCCKKGKKMPDNFGANISQRTKGNKNPRYIKVDIEIINKIIIMYTIEKFGIVEIARIVNLPYYKIKSILIENNVKIIKNQFKKRHYYQ